MLKIRRLGSWIVNGYAKDFISPDKLLPIPIIDNVSDYVRGISDKEEARELLRVVRGF